MVVRLMEKLENIRDEAAMTKSTYYPGTYPQRLTTMKNLRIADAPAEIQTHPLQNTSLQTYSYSNVPGPAAP
jgi:hypothetical protein